MPHSRLSRRGSPKGFQRWFLRFPIYLYRLKLGFLLGHRFVMITHVGRNSGKRRDTVLEVVWIDQRQVYVAAAWGESSDWYQNIRKTPDVTVHLASRTYPGWARSVDEVVAHDVLIEYAAHHPRAFKALVRLLVDKPGSNTDENVDKVAAVVPVVRLTPVE